MTKSLSPKAALVALIVVITTTASASPTAAVAPRGLQTCGDAQYDPAQYVCHDNHFLCPVVAGEPLAYCSGACYSAFMYTCTNNALALLPALATDTPFTLTASNPAEPAVDGLPVTACGLAWNVGGTTCAYCPPEVGQQGGTCPPGTQTVILGGGKGMAVQVPGGQVVYVVSPAGSVGYTQVHSQSMPAGATTGGLEAYQGGGLVNLNSGGWGWVACPSGTNGSGGSSTSYTLIAASADNQDSIKSCTPINLAVHPLASGTLGAWQYT